MPFAIHFELAVEAEMLDGLIGGSGVRGAANAIAALVVARVVARTAARTATTTVILLSELGDS